MPSLQVRARLFLLSAAVAGCASSGASVAPAPGRSPEAGLGYRIVAPAAVGEVTHARMLERLARADVVFFGEQHDDPETHRAEAEVLEAIGRSGRPVVVSLEMFERDVQAVVDDYLAGRVDEAAFLVRSRPWPRYATDYRRLVELAKANRWPVIAANVPRPLASAIGRRGLAALDTLTPAERANAARENICPRDDYRARFLESMRSHSPGGGTAAPPSTGGTPPTAGAVSPPAATAPAAAPRVDSLPTAAAERFYVAQCVKDETMAESIVHARLAAPRNAVVVHFTGAFHSDYAQGTVARVMRRQPGWNLAVISAVPVADPAVAPIVTRTGLADFVIFTRRTARQP